MTFERNVFVNCPFDDGYLPLLRPLLFAIIYLGFIPRIALENVDSGRPRVERIISMIQESKYAIHDLSRLKAENAGEYFRLNMPFELGLDVACRLFKRGKWAGKKCLILEAERYRYQAAISDLAGSDIIVHANDPMKVSKAVRDWLNTHGELRASGPAEVWNRFTDFMGDNYDLLKARGYSDEDIKGLPIADLIEAITDWMVRLNGTPQQRLAS